MKPVAYTTASESIIFFMFKIVENILRRMINENTKHRENSSKIEHILNIKMTVTRKIKIGNLIFCFHFSVEFSIR